MNDPFAGGDGMLPLLAAMPDHLAASERLPGLADVMPPGRPVRRVLLCGLGGSAVAGELMRPLVAAAGVQLTVWRDYETPAWLGDDTLVVLSSYSGDTEETLAAARRVLAAGLPALAITSGGALLALARAGHADGRTVPAVVLPAGLPPRAALGHGLGALLWALHRAGVTPTPRDDLADAVAELRAGCARWLVPGDPTADAAPAALARALLGRFTVIFTTSPEAHGAGVRLRAQLNENAKHPASLAEFPELDHNEIVGWEVLHRRREAFALVILRGGDEHPRTTRRVAITRELLAGEFHSVHELTARGARPLTRVLSLVQQADVVSCRLAEAAGVDPLPVARIDALKARLREE
ncbi:MAG: bifunctional phosphoglucose/phosphomannose isomerase [Candidatus Krumholzibacteriia bacterium]